MKYLTALLLLTLAFAAFSTAGEMGQVEARELGRVAAEGIPECLHVGETVEARIWPEAEAKGDAFDLTVRMDNDEVSATPARVDSRDAPAIIAFRGEKIGRERVVIRAPERSYIAPLTAFVRILPSIEPPHELTTQVTENISRIGRYAEGWMAYGQEWAMAREIVLGWRPKDGVSTYLISIFTFQRKLLGYPFHVPGGDNSYVARVPPGERYYWRIQAFFQNCEGEAILTPESPFIPFDA